MNGNGRLHLPQGFTPIRAATRLTNGQRPATWAAIQLAVFILSQAPASNPVEAFVRGWEMAMTHAVTHPQHAQAWRLAYDAELADDLGFDAEALRASNRQEVEPFSALFAAAAVTERAEPEEGYKSGGGGQP
jgi:hypothetical protein